jgi:hypothetical protein
MVRSSQSRTRRDVTSKCAIKAPIYNRRTPSEKPRRRVSSPQTNARRALLRTLSFAGGFLAQALLVLAIFKLI